MKLFIRQQKGKEYSYFSINLIAKSNISLEYWMIEHLPELIEFYLKEERVKLDDFDVNYGHFTCNSIAKLKEYIAKGNYIEYLTLSNSKKDFIYILFKNAINDINHQAELTVCVDIAHQSLLLNFFMKINLTVWQYGYGMNLLSNQTLIGSFIKKGFFSSQDLPLSDNQIWNNLWLDNNLLEEGFIKNIYQLNIFNKKQAANINLENFENKGIGKFHYISNKIFWILDDSEIVIVKKDLIKNNFLVNK